MFPASCGCWLTNAGIVWSSIGLTELMDEPIHPRYWFYPPSFLYCCSSESSSFCIMWNYCHKQGFLYLFSLFLSRCVVWQDNSTTNFGFPLEPLWDFRRLQFTISRRICGICLALPSERHVLPTLQQMLAFSFFSIPVYTMMLGIEIVLIRMKVAVLNGTVTLWPWWNLEYRLTLNWWSRLIVLEN